MSKLKNHQEFFQQITAPLIEGVVIFDKLGVVQTVNRAVSDLFGYSENELLGSNIQTLIPESPDGNYDGYIANQKDAKASNASDVGREIEGHHKNGSSFTLNLKMSKVSYEEQSFYMGILYSLKVQKRSDQTIKNQAELLERAEKVGQLGHWRLDLLTNEVFWSKEIYRIHGIAPKEFLPTLENAVNFYHKDDLQFVKDTLEDAIKHNKDFTFEARVVRNSGEICHVRSSGECSTDHTGRVTSVFGIFQNITDQVLATKYNQENNDFQNLIMKTIPDFMFIKDRDFKIIQANDAFINVYPEDKRDSVIGFTTLENYDAKDVEEFLKHDEKAFQDGSSETEETLVFPDGEERTLLTKKVRFQKQDGDEYILGLSRDISELKNTQINLLHANEELEEFAYRTSHDLRSPLVSAISLLSLAKGAIIDGNTERALQSIDHIHSSLVKLETLVKDILALTRVKNVEEQEQEIDIPELVESAIKKLSYMENFERLTFKTNFSSQGIIKSKPSRVQVIIENLLSNAIKYQDIEEEASYVEISTHRDEDTFTLKVEDNGLGIPEGQQGKLFQMFQRFHNKVSFGSGLGLYMIKKSADVIGATAIFLSSSKGTTFKLVIPNNKENN